MAFYHPHRAREANSKAAARDVADVANRAFVRGRMPAIYLGHGAPPLVDDSSGPPSSPPGLVPYLDPERSWWSRRTGEKNRSPSARPATAFHSSTTSPASPSATTDHLSSPPRRPSWPRVCGSCSRRRECSRAARARARPRRLRSAPDHVPQGDVPVLQISMPSLAPKRLLEVGARLRPLRDEGLLVIGSGFLTHGLPYLRTSEQTHRHRPGRPSSTSGQPRHSPAATWTSSLASATSHPPVTPTLRRSTSHRSS